MSLHTPKNEGAALARRLADRNVGGLRRDLDRLREGTTSADRVVARWGFPVSYLCELAGYDHNLNPKP